MLSFCLTETMFMSNRTQVMCQSYDIVLHFGDENVLCSLHLVVSSYQLLLIFVNCVWE
jgi:hypothetical protein